LVILVYFPFYFGFFMVGCAVLCHALMSGR